MDADATNRTESQPELGLDNPVDGEVSGAGQASGNKGKPK